jgi:ATP-dependent DNA helicase RecG
MLNVDQKIETISKINKKYLSALEKLGIKTIRDFLFHFPFRFEDYSERIPISDLRLGETATIMGEVTSSKLTRTWKRKMMITECKIKDETGMVRAVWFNQPYISDSLTTGKGVRISGKISTDKNGIYFSNPAWELSSREPTNTGRLVPVYPETEGISSRWIRWQMQGLVKYAEEIPDPIPENILKKLHLPSLKDALNFIHFPKTLEQTEIAQKRFAFEQIFVMQLASEMAKNSWQKNKAPKILFDEKLTKKFVSSLPFSLTNAQRKASFQIYKDLEKNIPMNRLLNGDVGSGKTIVAAMATLGTINSNYQVAIMAPTEVLALQHFESFCKIFKDYNFTIALLTNSYQLKNNFKFKILNLKLKEDEYIKLKKTELLEIIKNNKIDIIIGTHALIQKDVHFGKLGLVIIDEQHRFGVNQRAQLLRQTEKIDDGLPQTMPHFLTMTATPIPRTLAIAFFGHLDLSILDEMPKNRKPIITKLIAGKNRNTVYEFIRSKIKNGRQAFVILPLVDESEKMADIKAVITEHKRLSEKIFPDLSLAFLHGKMPAKEKEQTMTDFKNKKYDILVATSVVEVGIDIPNATIIVIEDSDRFGLSQLHQFRGRVGRGEFQSYCFLFTESNTAKAKQRLGVLVKHLSGFEVAEKDFAIRGAGEFLGTRQSGINDIAMKHLTNVKLIEIAHSYAQDIIKENFTLRKYPLLKKEVSRFNTNVHLE